MSAAPGCLVMVRAPPGLPLPTTVARTLVTSVLLCLCLYAALCSVT